jgi:LssY C-terminus
VSVPGCKSARWLLLTLLVLPMSAQTAPPSANPSAAKAQSSNDSQGTPDAQEREVWVASSTHDIAVEHTKTMTKWTHRIDPYIDRERDWIESDLLFAGTATGYVDVNRPAAPRHAANATGDSIVTDGMMTVVRVGSGKTPAAGPPQLNTR